MDAASGCHRRLLATAWTPSRSRPAGSRAWR